MVSSDNHGGNIQPVFLALGIIFLTLEIILALGLAAMVKSITDTVPFFTILLARYAFCLPLLFAYGVWQRGNKVLSISNWKTLSLRISSGMLGLFSWFGAVIYIDISLPPPYHKQCQSLSPCWPHLLLPKKWVSIVWRPY